MRSKVAVASPLSGDLFAIDGDSYTALNTAAGPWSADHCHGGAVAALFGHATTTVPMREPMEVVRLTCDFLSPVPIGVPLAIDRLVEKDGRKMQLLSFTLSAGEMMVARASVLRIRTEGRQAPERKSGFAPDPSWPRAHVHGEFARQFEMVSEKGGFGVRGPGRLWFRLLSHFANGQRATPLARALACADFANGFASDLPFADWSFPTLDLSVHLSRQPVGDWIIIDAQSHSGAAGRAQCFGKLEDEAGLFAECMQSVFVTQRRG